MERVFSIRPNRAIRIGIAVVLGLFLLVMIRIGWVGYVRSTAINSLEAVCIASAVIGDPKLVRIESCSGKYAPTITFEWHGPNRVSALIGTERYLLLMGEPRKVTAGILVTNKDLLPQLRHFRGLRSLDLSEVEVSDADLALIGPLRLLEELTFDGHCFTAASLGRLRLALPNLRIRGAGVRDADGNCDPWE